MNAQPQTSVEATISEIWSEVLGRNAFGRCDNFFDLGGDSLRAMEVISRLHQRLQLELPLIAFFEDPTVSHLAAVIHELQQGQTDGVDASEPGSPDIPLSFAQLTFWLLQQRQPSSSRYNEPRVLRLRGPLRSQILQQSLNELRRRHAVLRTRFVPGPEEPTQRIDLPSEVELEVENLSTLPAAARLNAALSAARELWRQPFDLAAGPALRVRLLRLADDDHILVVVMHHLISDGHTDALFFSELSTVYGALAASRPSPLTEPVRQYADHARLERQQIQGSRLQGELEFWRSQLDGAPAQLELPTDHMRAERASDAGDAGDAGDACSLQLGEQLLAALRSFAQSNGTTLFAVLLTGVRLLLSRWSAQRDIVIGTVSGNRSRAGLDQAVGCFLNFLPLRNRVDSEGCLLDAVQREHRLLMEAFAHQECPFVQIAAAVAPARGGADNPLYNVAFLLQNFPEMRFRVNGLAAEFINLPVETALLDLRFVATERPDGLQLDCEFRSGLFERATIELVLSGVQQILADLCLDPERTIATLPMPQLLLQQARTARERNRKLKLAIAATFTAEPIAETLEFWAQQLGIPLQVEFAPYNQVFQQLLDPAGLLAGNREGINVVLLRMEDWLRDTPDPSTDASEGLRRNVVELIAAIRNAALKSTAPLLLCTCPPSARTTANPAMLAALGRLEQTLFAGLEDLPSVHSVGYREVLRLYPTQNYLDEYAERLGQIPYTAAFFTALGTMLARRLSALRRPPHKVIVLDCDNTLWRGVCAEEGPLGVSVDAGHRAVQELALEQQRAGMLLCLCSKNVEEDVAAVFELNAGMILRREQFAAARINWQPKSENLRRLAQELNLGLDSFVLIDDSALECEEVRRHCPEVLTVQLPSAADDIRSLLDHVWVFDRRRLTAEDELRAAFYGASLEREQLRRGAATLDDFLAGLELQVEIRELQPSDLARAAQLTARTNQFNLTTIRHTEPEISQLCQNGAECLVVDVADRFGDYGTVGLMIHSQQHDCLRIDTLLLSCRALGRKVEHRLLSHAGELAQQRQLARVDVGFIASRKNRPARDFLESVGAQFRDGSPEQAVYRFPAGYAAGVHLLPEEVPLADTSVTSAAAAEQQPSAPPPAVSRQLRCLSELALRLRDVRSIAHAVESNKQLRSFDRGQYVAPRTPTEEMVAGIWTRLLQVERLGVHGDFFALGGHSLLAAQMVARIRQALGVELPLRAVFDAPTVAELARLIDAARQAPDRPSLPELQHLAREQPLPASFAQQRLWFLDQLEPGNPIYNVPQMFRLRGRLDLEALRQSLHEIARRHEALRTTFTAVHGQPMQVIAATLEVPLPVVDLSRVAAGREAEARRLAQEEALLPFDLQRGSLLRARLLRLNVQEHLLLLSMHHIVSDRWSMGVLADELGVLYTAFAQGRPSPLPDLSLQYADYAAWQRCWLTGAALDGHIQYWKRQLAEAPEVLALPMDRPRPAVQTFRGATLSRILPQRLIDQLTIVSQSEGATLFMILLAGFQVLLSRYSGQEDIVVGSPVANRNHAEVEPLIGLFVNTLALRTDLTGDPSFRDLLARIRESTLQAYAHQDIPFEKLVEELQPERSLSHHPVFQVMFALQNAPLRPPQMWGLELERLPLYTATSMFDLSWFAIEVAEGLQLRCEYNRDLFDESTMARALEHFENLLRGITADPAQPISRLPLAGADELERVLVQFNDSARDYAPGGCIHQLLEARAASSPESIALVIDRQRISYRELNERANRIAHYLMALGSGPDVLIGIHTERSADMVAGILGILKSGAAYVPLDPAYPAERLRSILEDAAAPIVLTQQALTAQLPPLAARLICLDSERSIIDAHSSANPSSRVRPENLAFVLFTSGSTGRPKGVALEHRNAVNFVRWTNELLTPQELAGVLFCTSICFDMSTFEMFVTIGAGGTMILAQGPLDLPTLAAREQITLINTVPSAIQELVRLKALPGSLTTVVLAGEALPQSLADEIHAAGVGRLFNMYGPTETGYTTSTLVSRHGAITIGKPIANARAYVLDKRRWPQPVGVPGEIYLAGDGTARGYHGRPDLTGERFVSDPFAGSGGKRMYRTGDLGRWLPDGNLQYLGRIDHQVKLRGFRVELGEIEAALAGHPGVQQTLVMAREDRPGIKQLVAYVVASAAPAPTPGQLRGYLERLLPDFMLPSALMVLESFPLTPNGKIDRKALPVPDCSRDGAHDYLAPRTPVESTIAALWGELLQLPNVGVHDGFFALGGHSLLATQLVSRLRDAFHVELPLRTIFESPTVAALAVRVADAQSNTAPAASAARRIARVPRQRLMPPSFSQQRLWYLDQLEPGTSTYNIPWTLRLTGPLNRAALERSFNALLERHETLRTSFTSEDGLPWQHIHSQLQLALQFHDLSALPPEQREPEARALIAGEARTPFDLQRAPLLRSTLLRLEEQQHILLINIHHIVSDRWSMGAFAQQLALLYDALLESREALLPELPVQYADFAVWQREWLRGAVLDEQLAYWKQQLKGAPAFLDLPTDRPRLPVESFNGDIARFRVSKQLAEKLNALAQAENATLFMVLLAAFQVLMSRLSGQSDVVVGVPVASRGQAEIEGLIGFFANTLPLRAELGGDPAFREVVRAAREAALGAYAHQDLPFEKLVEELRPERSLSHSPLVQVFFVLQNAPMETLRLRGLQLAHVESMTKTSKGELFFSLIETVDGMRGAMEYNTDLFDGPTIERMLEQFHVLLEAVVSDSTTAVSRLPLLSGAARRELLEGWNSSAEEYPRESCLHELIEQQAERRPQAIACQYEQEQLSYEQLNRRANQLAHWLRGQRIGPGQRVGLYIERSLDMMIGLLGIQKCGAAYVPLDPGYPQERIRLILEDAQVPVLITQQSLAGLIEGQHQLLCLDRDWEQIAAQESANPRPLAQPQDLLYVIFTSGSTGRPKGVQVSHRAVVNLLCSMAQRLQMSASDVFPALASFAFDMCIPELYLALICGGRVVIGDRHLSADGERLAAVLRASGATVVHATPTTWGLLLEAGFSGAGLKRAIGAEPLPRALCTRLLQAEPSLYNFYGPTETTVWSTVHHFSSVDEPLVIGRPLANTQVYILDRHLEPVPIGVAGELYIGGDGVASGYLKRPQLDAERFIADPFASTAGRRMYRTGDLGRYLSDGRIEFLGRADHQVKLRGYRIELGEIEAVLNRHAAVKQCVVAAREDQAGDKRLVAYVVPHDENGASAADWHAWNKDRLPEYMLPAAYVTLQKLPLSPNGKVDRAALPAPDYVHSGLARSEGELRTPAEEVIAGIWEDVLRLERVGRNDQFFDLGGHSLLATRVVSRIRQAFDVDLPLRTLFEAPVLAALTERVQLLARERHGLSSPPLERAARDRRLPLSFAQQRLWFLDQLEANKSIYNVPHVVRIGAVVDATVLERALNEIVRRHEVLRTTFQLIDGEPAQVIAPQLTLSLSVTDLTTLPPSEREQQARQLSMEEIRRPFDLMNGPLLRARLLRLASADCVLVLSTHHIVSDRWSLGVLWQELTALYQAFSAGSASPLAALPLQYCDYAVWQRRCLSDATLEQQLQYWRQQLAGAPSVLELPADKPRPREQSFHGAKLSFNIEPALTARLKALSRAQGATFFMTLLAAFGVLLSRYSRQDEIVIGSPTAGRTRAEVEQLIGLFVNTLLLRLDMSDNPSFLELLQRARSSAMGAYAHQELPFEKLVEELRPERDLSRNPLFQVMLILQNVPAIEPTFAGAAVSAFLVPAETSKFDLTLIAVEADDAVRATFEYNTELFEASTIERLAQHLLQLLTAAVDNPAARVLELPLLGDSERNQILLGWNRTQAALGEQSVCELIEQQAARTPEAIACQFQSERLSYAQLDRRANQLARYLQRAGVGPETLVGLCLERSLDMVIALLAILKAGGTYLPLDPTHPSERISFILEDAQAKLLISSRALLSKLASAVPRRLALEELWDQIAAESGEQLPAPPSDAAAYLLYTSGSTGKPKGVRIEHRNLSNFLLSMQCRPGLTSADTLLALTTLSFDIAGLELYLPLISGARLVLASREEAADGNRLLALLTESGVTVMQATPATWRMLIECGWQGSPGLKALCGGEALPADLAAQLLSRCAQLWNLYGPTETTIWSSLFRVESVHENPVPIGRPIANTSIYLLDQCLQPVPIGVTGELHIAGAGVARGYHNRPELTAERFLPDPFQSGQRMYRSGDLARFLPDGTLQYLGRSDFQVKLRGFRIELGEIEQALAQQAAVAQAVVLLRADVSGERTLVAYLVFKPGQSAALAQLRAHLRRTLPEYMVPGAFVILDALPLTPNGKLDRKALPAPELNRSDSTSAGNGAVVEPRDDFELIVLRVWQRILRLDAISVRDDFFDLGGHSFLAVRMINELKRVSGRDLPLAELFRGATIEHLAAILRGDSAPLAHRSLMAIQGEGSEPPFFAAVFPGANALGYLTLSRILGHGQPFYKLQGPGELLRHRPYTDLENEQLAIEYVRLMRAIQPEGPYYIGGMCEGARIAFDMARVLEAQGQQVALLAIFDTWAVENSQVRWLWYLHAYSQRLKRLWQQPRSGKWGTVKEAVRKKAQRVQDTATFDQKAWHAYYWPPVGFTPQRVKVAITAFKIQRQPYYYVRDPLMGWAARTNNGVDVHHIKAKHLQLLREPWVRNLGHALRDRLHRARESAQATAVAPSSSPS
jgi:amino acid adenylation domain-containing protein/FkbH-like protein